MRACGDHLKRHVLLLVVVFTVEQAITAVAGAGQCSQAHGTLDARLMPEAVIHTQEEAVGDGRLAACANLSTSNMLYGKKKIRPDKSNALNIKSFSEHICLNVLY